MLVVWVDRQKPAANEKLRSALQRCCFFSEDGPEHEYGYAVSARRREVNPIRKAAWGSIAARGIRDAVIGLVWPTNGAFGERKHWLSFGWKMAIYRAYIVGQHSQFIRAVEMDCDNDSAAIESAKHLIGGHDVELWQMDRAVARFDSVSKQIIIKRWVQHIRAHRVGGLTFAKAPRQIAIWREVADPRGRLAVFPNRVKTICYRY
jgi:hypothetical protein